jgi:RNA polymerase sigma-70 factor (ECF subfamily)
MDDSKLRAMLESHHPDCFGWALSCCQQDWARAEDVLQEAYLRVLQGKARFQEKSSFKTWIFGVIRICAADSRRRDWWRLIGMERWQKKAIPPDSPEPPSQALDTIQKQKIFQAAILSLPRRQQEVLHLVFYQDLTLEQSAQILKISVGSARTHYDRAKKQLRKILRRDDYE